MLVRLFGASLASVACLMTTAPPVNGTKLSLGSVVHAVEGALGFSHPHHAK